MEISTRTLSGANTPLFSLDERLLPFCIIPGICCVSIDLPTGVFDAELRNQIVSRKKRL